MDRKTVRRIPAAALAAVIVLGAGSVTAYASWRYLTPENVTEQLKDTRLADAFRSESAVTVNETQIINGYRVTLLGILSGKDLTEYDYKSNGNVCEDRTYSVIAIEYADGRPMPDTSDDAYSDLSFFVSPLIKDYDPVNYNMATMRGGCSVFVENGVMYRLTECDNVEIFADHGLYLCVTDSTFYDNKAYHFDKTSGEITRNEDYDGLNALFRLPIDPSKADPQAAASYRTLLDEPDTDADENTSIHEPEKQARDNDQTPEANNLADTWMEQITPETMDHYARRVESTVQTLTPDGEGYVHFSYEIEGRGSGSWTILASEFLKDATVGVPVLVGSSMSGEGLDGLIFTTVTPNEDGTVTAAAYIPKEGLEKTNGITQD